MRLLLLQLTVLSQPAIVVKSIFGGVFVLSCCFLDLSEGIGAFVIGLNPISSFFSAHVSC